MKRILLPICLSAFLVFGAVFSAFFPQSVCADTEGEGEAPPPLTLESSKFPDYSSAYLIAGIAGGAIAVVGVTAAAVLIFRRKNK